MRSAVSIPNDTRNEVGASWPLIDGVLCPACLMTNQELSRVAAEYARAQPWRWLLFWEAPFRWFLLGHLRDEIKKRRSHSVHWTMIDGIRHREAGKWVGWRWCALDGEKGVER